MRTTAIRTAILVLLLACALPAAALASATSDRIYRDCEHSASGSLTGTYTKAQLRAALQNMPGDVAEYSGCSDAINQALLAGGHRGSGSGGGNGSGNAGDGTAGGGFSAGGSGAGAATPAGGGSAGANGPVAHASGSKAPVTLAGSPVQPGIVPSIGKDSSALPAPLIVLLVLLGAGALALGTTTLGRRVIARRRV
jgi:hypothetical protein